MLSFQEKNNTQSQGWLAGARDWVRGEIDGSTQLRFGGASKS